MENEEHIQPKDTPEPAPNKEKKTDIVYTVIALTWLASVCYWPFLLMSLPKFTPVQNQGFLFNPPIEFVLLLTVCAYPLVIIISVTAARTIQKRGGALQRSDRLTWAVWLLLPLAYIFLIAYLFSLT